VFAPAEAAFASSEPPGTSKVGTIRVEVWVAAAAGLSDLARPREQFNTSVPEVRVLALIRM
jgi:hypothetical protein